MGCLAMSLLCLVEKEEKGLKITTIIRTVTHTHGRTDRLEEHFGLYLLACVSHELDSLVLPNKAPI